MFDLSNLRMVRQWLMEGLQALLRLHCGERPKAQARQIK
jgi:hypothetical protein